MTRGLPLKNLFPVLLLLAALAAVLTVTATGASAASSARSAPFVSTIQSATLNTCIDVPGGTTDINTDLVAAACGGAPEQNFRFTHVAKAPGAYRIRSIPSGLCIHNYRFGIRQFFTCTAVAHPSDLEWVLRAIPGTAHQYQLEPRSFVGSSLPRCAAAHAGGGLSLDFCNASAGAGQIFTIATTP